MWCNLIACHVLRTCSNFNQKMKKALSHIYISGLYMFGNMEILKKNSELWTQISNTLESKGFLGSSLLLKCENHQEQNTTVSTYLQWCDYRHISYFKVNGTFKRTEYILGLWAEFLMRYSTIYWIKNMYQHKMKNEWKGSGQFR